MTRVNDDPVAAHVLGQFRSGQQQGGHLGHDVPVCRTLVGRARGGQTVGDDQVGVAVGDGGRPTVSLMMVARLGYSTGDLGAEDLHGDDDVVAGANGRSQFKSSHHRKTNQGYGR